MPTKIIKCDCDGKSPYQDIIYGHGYRVMNTSKDGKTYTCTVCGKKHKGD